MTWKCVISVTVIKNTRKKIITLKSIKFLNLVLKMSKTLRVKIIILVKTSYRCKLSLVFKKLTVKKLLSHKYIKTIKKANIKEITFKSVILKWKLV